MKNNDIPDCGDQRPESGGTRGESVWRGEYEGVGGVDTKQAHFEIFTIMNHEQINSKTYKIREHIRKGEVKESLEELNQFIQAVDDSKVDKDFLLLSAQYHSAERNIFLNLTNGQEEKNRVLHGIIILMGEVKECALKKFIPDITQKFKVSEPEPSGYCIRTGRKIPFNLDKPLSPEAFKIWAQFENIFYRENFCHFSGEDSYGETCFINPVLGENWRKAMRIHKL